MEETAKRREDIMRRVAGLLAKADSTDFSAERDNLIAKADELMSRYAIETYELEMQADKKVRRKPELRDIEYGSTGNSEADEQMVQVFYALAELTGCLLPKWGWRSSKVIGYPEDLDYLTMLFFNVRIHLAGKLEPKPDPHLSMEENLVMLKEAGLKWVRIYELLHGAGQIKEPWERKVGVKFTGIYTRYCKENNRPRMYSNPDVWRRNFIVGYSQEIRNRIYDMRAAREKAAQGKELVLVSMKDELQEFMYEMFPKLRPHPANCDCDLHHVCDDRKCMRPNCVARRMPVKASRRPRTPRELKYDAAAMSAGRQTAKTADLGSARGAPASSKKEIN